MQLTEEEIIQKCGNLSEQCNRNMLLPYEYEKTCISFGNNVIKRKPELSRVPRKNINSINRLEYAQHNIFCLCIDVYKICEISEFFIHESLLKLKIKN